MALVWAKAWEDYLDSEGSILRRIELPKVYYQSREHFLDFVAHGHLHLNPGDPPGFQLTALPKDQLRLLHDFLVSWIPRQDWNDSEAYKIIRNTLGMNEIRFREYAVWWAKASRELLGRSTRMKGEWWWGDLWQACQGSPEVFFGETAIEHFVGSLGPFLEEVGLDDVSIADVYDGMVAILARTVRVDPDSADRESQDWQKTRES